MKTVRCLLLNLLILLFSVSLAAQDAPLEHKTSIFELLTATAGNSLTLSTDFVALRESRTSDQYFPGALTLSDGQTYSVKLKSRGMFRRKMGEIPPLKIKFSKKDLRGFGLDTLNEVKLVVPFTTNEKGDELVIREYLAYKMWEHLSPYSTRAGLVQLTLRDAHTGKEQLMYCILLEDKDETVARLQGELVETFNLPQSEFDPEQLALVGVFQYMIGNADWNLTECRNLRFVRLAGQSKLIAIPYDFDFSGLVNAPYAYRLVDSERESVRRRSFMLGSLTEADLNAATQKLLAARTELTALCESPYLPKRAVKDMSGYLDGFFEKLPTCGLIPCAPAKTTESAWTVSQD